MKTFRLNDFEVGGQSLCVIAGPCLAESDDLCLRVAEEMVRHCADLGFPYIFKASFDKANRSSVATGRGDGLAAGLRRLENVKKAFGVPVTTDIHWPAQAREVAEGVDLLQIPAFLCRQSDLLQAAAETGRPVNVKKGQFLAPWDAKNIVDKLDHFGASGVLLTERGTSFGYNTLVVDMPGLEVMRGMGVPVCFDATHSAQRPGASGQETGGVRESIPAMSRAAVAVGVDAIFLEVHPDPSTALSDRATQWPLDQIRPLLEQIAAVDRAVRAL